MRNLALILLLANLGLLGWQHWLREPPVAQPRVLPDVPLLQIARGVTPPPSGEPGTVGRVGAVSSITGVPGTSESDEPDDSAEATEAPEATGANEETGPMSAGRAPVPTDALQCVALGPFGNAATAAAAAESLQGQVADVRERTADGREWIGYWVRLEHDSREAAGAAVLRLHDAGRDDAYLIPGEDVHFVSLGVFSTRVRAERLHDEVQALGEQPLIVDRFRDGTVYWLDLVLSDGEAPDPAALAAAEGPPPALQPAACPPGAATD